MEWIEVIIHTTTEGAEIVSEQLTQEGAEGTMTEDRADVPDPAKPSGYWEIIDPGMIDAMPEDVLVHAWFKPDSRLPDRLRAVESRMAQLLAESGGVQLRMELPSEAERRAFNPMNNSSLDSSGLEADYGFRPSIGIREGLHKFAEWYKEYYRG